MCPGILEDSSPAGQNTRDLYESFTRLNSFKETGHSFRPCQFRTRFIYDIDCEQSLFGQSRLSSAGLETAN